ncbi:MAG: arginine--tRNA ligase [Alphaproteobacteria bacterium]|nr:arginine--tRNA ligase [Alphaproteobacteria bacterium]
MNIYNFISDNIKSKIQEIDVINAALTPDVLNNIVVEVPKIRDFGDFSTNVAMVLVKLLKKSPRDIAEMILPKLSDLDFVESVSIAGPGFINIKLKDAFLIAPEKFAADKCDDSKKLMLDLDYGSYNIGKALHIGHLRTTVVGDTFNRIARYLGHKTKSYNHMGDWGRPMGLIIAWILEYGMPKNADDINVMYPASAARAKEDKAWLERAQKVRDDLQNGNPEYLKIYNEFAPMSLAQIKDILLRLNILPFDENKGERLVAEYVPDVQKILDAKNLIVHDDGADVIPVKQDDDTAPMPPVLWRSSTGAQTYAAADLAAIYYRTTTDNPTDIVYFTDSRQNLHFTQVFRAAKLAGMDSANLQHIGFGTITGADGKPFKTRDGDVPSLHQMVDMVAESVRRRAQESGKELPEETVEMIALAALKFNDLMHDVRADYVFDIDSVTQFEGRTGPYILYTAVRLNSVVKKAAAMGIVANAGNDALQPEERNLLLRIMDFTRVIENAFARRATDLLANYTYDLCQDINTFYHHCPILRDDVDAATKQSRLHLVNMAQKTLLAAIDLMGLRVPDAM